MERSPLDLAGRLATERPAPRGLVPEGWLLRPSGHIRPARHGPIGTFDFVRSQASREAARFRSVLGQNDEGFAFLDDVGRKLGPVALASVADCVNRLGRDDQSLAGVVCLRPRTVDLILERPLEDVDDLLTRMFVPDQRRFVADLDAVLDDLPPRSTQILPLQIDPRDP